MFWWIQSIQCWMWYFPCYITVTSHEHQSVSNYWLLNCLYNNLYRVIKNTSYFCIFGPLWRNLQLTGEFLAQRATNQPCTIPTLVALFFATKVGNFSMKKLSQIYLGLMGKYCYTLKWNIFKSIFIFLRVFLICLGQFFWLKCYQLWWPKYPVHDDVIKWKHFPRNWPFARGIHRSPVDSPHKGQWRRALMFSLICAWTHGWANSRDAGDLRCHHAHYDVTVMQIWFCTWLVM